MKKNSFRKYINLMRKSENYFIEYDGNDYYIANPYMLLRVPQQIYFTYFYNVNSINFPIIMDTEKTLSFCKHYRQCEHSRNVIDKRLNLQKNIPNNDNQCELTNVQLQLKTALVNCFITRSDKPFITTVNAKFVKAFSDIFDDQTNTRIYGGQCSYNPIVYKDIANDITGMLLPIRDVNNTEIKNAILKEYNVEV